MNLQAIYVANFTGFLLIFLLSFSRYITRTKSDLEEHAFDSMAGLAMIACLIEPLTFAVDGIKSPVAYWIMMIGNTYVDLMLFHDKSRMKRIYYKLSIPVGLLLLSLLGNIFFKYYFYVDDNFIYHRQPTIYIFYIYLMLCAIYSFALYIYQRHHKKGISFFPIYMYLVPIVTGSLIQMIFYGLSTAWLGTAIGIVALYMSLQQQKTYIDQLTGLYNRHYLEHYMYQMSQNSSSTYYGIMIDMNDFKSINDEYGHSLGDQALTHAANIFSSALTSNSTAFRYAGDEFIIITKTKDENEVIKIENALNEITRQFNLQKKLPCSISFSMGHNKYVPNVDDSDSFLKKIDEAMYEQKKRYHNG